MKSGGQMGTLKKVLSYVKKYRLFLIASIVLSAAVVCLTLYVPILIGKAIDNIISAGNVKFSAIGMYLAKAGVIIVITGLLQWVVNTVNNKITFNVVRDIRKTAFQKIQTLPLSFLDSHSSGDIVSRIIGDVDQFSDGLLIGFTQLFTSLASIIATLVFMVSINYKVALVVVVLTPLSLFVAKFIAKHTYDMFKEQSKIRGEQTGFIDEMIGNQKTVKSFSKENDTLKKFDEINEKLSKCSLKAIFFSSTVNPGTRFVNSIVYAAVALTGAILAVGNAITVGGLSCFLSYANQYTKPFNEISGVVTELQNALACADRIFSFIEEKSEPQEELNENAVTELKGDVEFRNVYFSYTDKQKLIENFNFSAKKGQKIAIVGPTGCGKTTLINLLMRFYEVCDGEILIDGKNIKTIPKNELRSNFGMVLQDTWIKNGTVRENIALGKPNATEDEIIAAAKETHAHSFIKRLPNGYDTVISDETGGLSIGQRQLLCITRVMLLKPPMLILDEATSSIDTRTEMRVQRSFDKLMANKTSFIVAHRLSTIQKADKILVMNKGNIIEQGTHNELMSEKGFYYNLYNSQFAV